MKEKKKIIDIVCVSLVAVLFGGVAVLNIAQKDRPTESESEKRTLAKMPEFTWESLKDGSYFSGIAAFISDTFIKRDEIVDLSKEIDTLKGFDYSIDGEGNFVILSPKDETNNENDHSELSDKLNEAMDSLKNQTTEAEESTEISSETDESKVLDGEIIDETALDNTEDIDNLTDETETETQSNEQDGEQSDHTETETEPVSNEPKVTAIHLSKTSLKLTVGTGSVIYATVDSDSNEGATVKWSVSDKNVASISINESGGINIKGMGAGNAVLSCSYGDIIETCRIEVTEVTSVTNEQNNQNADFLPSGLFIYGDAVYTQAWYSDSAAEVYAQTVKYYKQLFGSNTRVSVVVAPVSSMVVDNEEVRSKIEDQDEMIQKIGAHMDSTVNFVNPYADMYAHKDEYLFFKSDHHWTQKGAYYAYTAFCESVGLKPTPLSDFTYEIRNNSYSGSLYSWTNDVRVKNFTDTIEAFLPTKSHTMTVTTSNGATYNYDTSIVNTNTSYVTFIAGDNPYTVINVPDNPQDKSVLVLKDSFGNAFVPFLCEHYGNIIVVDVRYSNFNIYEQLKDYGLSDIIFVNNIQAVTASWAQMYLSAVGVN